MTDFSFLPVVLDQVCETQICNGREEPAQVVTLGWKYIAFTFLFLEVVEHVFSI